MPDVSRMQPRCTRAIFSRASRCGGSVVDWQLIDDLDDAQKFAERINKPATGPRRGTSLSNAILYGTASIDSNAFLAFRRVLDASGDGPNNTGPPITPARQRGGGGQYHRCRSGGKAGGSLLG
ncbi:DUF1194 domain-containing protein [Sinorhizobium meliloti]|nr:DUF1194 domain-containing protein [Sinorhizobium meliloti]MDW9495874.1 DUF1194 domain-containing protein [Sinorhizobium meliloti]MDW9564974.1 DUF1194 domain-containing protein [Sinorhizobium meliloti]MDW9652470.1 DUF1194 domain-containing protein [Sinorhizobium meliloti]MDW9724754.1 DUF1194 domain-containing protein [Sinorhizobium meliloti]